MQNIFDVFDQYAAIPFCMIGALGLVALFAAQSQACATTEKENPPEEEKS